MASQQMDSICYFLKERRCLIPKKFRQNKKIVQLECFVLLMGDFPMLISSEEYQLNLLV